MANTDSGANPLKRISVPHLLIIAGTGSKSGKTTMACRIISLLGGESIAVKITPHYHELTAGAIEIMKGEGYSVREETDAASEKDTSRMLKAGASKVFLVLVWDASVFEVFMKLFDIIPQNSAVICESPALRDFVNPGLFVLVDSGKSVPRDELRHLANYPHLSYNPEIYNEEVLNLDFADGRWILKNIEC